MKNQQELQLSAREFDLLFFLMSQAGRACSRQELLNQVWGYDYHDDLRIVDAVIKRLRSKLREATPEAEWIVTVRGVGYKLSP